MLTLDALGYRAEDIPAFDWSKYSIEQARRFFILGRGEVRLLREIIARAEQNERYDIEAALEHAIRRSSPLMWMTNLERYIRRQVPAVNHYKTPLKALKATVIRRLGFDSP